MTISRANGLDIYYETAGTKGAPVMVFVHALPFEGAPLLAKAARIFRQLADKAAAALQMEKCPAAVAWREIFRENRSGWVFTLPPGCDASGKSVPSVESNPSLGNDEARGYARP